jgi:hypothetical protein
MDRWSWGMDQEMKMVRHQAPCQDIGNRAEELSNLPNKEKVVVFRKENLFVGPVKYMIYVILFKMHECIQSWLCEIKLGKEIAGIEMLISLIPHPVKREARRYYFVF